MPTFVGVNSITTEGAIKNEFDKLGKFKLASSSLNDNSYWRWGLVKGWFKQKWHIHRNEIFLKVGW